jgi:hypothetical protein
VRKSGIEIEREERETVRKSEKEIEREERERQ